MTDQFENSYKAIQKEHNKVNYFNRLFFSRSKRERDRERESNEADKAIPVQVYDRP